METINQDVIKQSETKQNETFAGKLINRYKIHFYLFWIVLFTVQTLRSTVEQPLRPVLLGHLGEIGSGALFAFIVLYVLLPRFWKNGKRIYFVIFSAALLFVAAFISSYSDYLVVLSVGLSYERANYWPRIPGQLVYVFLVASSFGFIKIADDYFREKSNSETLKKDKLRAELELLKAQINPHFLFNTLNNLYFMIEQDPPRAAKMILMLSDILRYQIYETDMDKTGMDKEIENIKNYIELEKIRKDDIEVTFEIKGNPAKREVLPNILLPLVENAFTHIAIKPDGSCSLSILIEESDGELIFTVKNTSSNNDSPKQSSGGGLGIANLKKRLDLFYPNKHVLEINPQKDDNSFEVKLRLYAD